MNNEIETSKLCCRFSLADVVMAAAGAAAVCLAYNVLCSMLGAVVAVIPYIAGGLLFCTLVGSFYFLLRFLKKARKTPRLRISFWDCYTALAVFTVMGYMATACMHAFQSGENSLAIWNQGCFAAVIFTAGFGLARFAGELWSFEDKDKSRRRD